MNAAPSHQATVPRPFPLWRRLFYLFVILLQSAFIIHYGREWDRSVQREAEYSRQVATLVAENKRLREHCPQEPTSGSLALR